MRPLPEFNIADNDARKPLETLGWGLSLGVPPAHLLIIVIMLVIIMTSSYAMGPLEHGRGKWEVHAGRPRPMPVASMKLRQTSALGRPSDCDTA